MKPEVAEQIAKMAEEAYAKYEGNTELIFEWNAGLSDKKTAYIRGAETVMDRLDIDGGDLLVIILNYTNNLDEAKQQILNAITIKEKP